MATHRSASHLLPLVLVLASTVLACGAVMDTPSERSVEGDTPPGRGTPPGDAPPQTSPGACNHGLLADDIARDGAKAVPSTHAASCTFLDYDAVGAVLRVAQTFDASGRALTVSSERLDAPPRTTEHDNPFVLPSRRALESFQYDAAGHMTLRTFDVDVDGTIDLERSWIFDALGREIGTSSRDGSTTSTVSRTLDAAGLPLLETTTLTGDPLRTTSWTRRPDGAPLTSERRYGAAIEGSATWTYDAADTSTRREDSAIRTTTTITDAKGHVLELREDQPKDGVDDYFRKYTYDAFGNVTRDRAYGNAGEKYDDLVATFDDAGRLVKLWKQWGHSQVGGPTTDTEERAYDACGQLVSVRSGKNGKPRAEIDRTYDSRGYLTAEETRSSLPAVKSTRVTRTFDASGRVTTQKTQDRDGGSWKTMSTETRSYDAAGHLVEKLTTPAIGPVGGETWTYDARGDLVRHEKSAALPGAIVREEMGYGCLP